MWGTPQRSRRISTCFSTPGTFTLSAASSAAHARNAAIRLIDTSPLLRRTDRAALHVEVVNSRAVAGPRAEVEPPALRNTIYRNVAECQRLAGLAHRGRPVSAQEVHHPLALDRRLPLIVQQCDGP